MSTTSTFSEADKFDGTNWSSWRRLIRTAAVSKGAYGYLDGSIKQPSTSPTPTSYPAFVTTETLWDSCHKLHSDISPQIMGLF